MIILTTIIAATYRHCRPLKVDRTIINLETFAYKVLLKIKKRFRLGRI